MALSAEDREAFMQTAAKVLTTGTKLKTVMLKKNITWAKTECPECGGWLHGRIVGKRQHMHMACENAECCMRMME